ncbi:MAG TPA: hypothetical protein VHZ96_21285 [Frankiaceae bacterium]|jgi:hypothetical protein|nr:hypothetical protein [Frankiaceae bacterium]
MTTSKPQTRILFGMAGTFTLVGTGLGAFAGKWFLLLPALVSANQLLMAARGWCPMSLLLTRLHVGTDDPALSDPSGSSAAVS